MKMHVRLLTIASFLAAITASSVLRAEITYVAVPGNLEENVIKMTVTPASEPKPSFKYRFVAEDIDLKQGNSAPYYYRAMLDLPDRMQNAKKIYDYTAADIDNWYAGDVDTVPLDKLPKDKLRQFVNTGIGGAIWDQLVEAANRRQCDFELGFTEIRGPELITVLLEEFQRSRELNRMLGLRTRLEVAEGRYDDAARTIRMNYRLAKDFGSVPFLVSGLIGIAEAGITNASVLELIAAPDSPNLYWALSELPDPLIAMRDAVRFELDFGPRMFPFIHRAEQTNRSPDEWNRLYIKSLVDLDWAGGSDFVTDQDLPIGDKNMAGVGATGIALLGYTHAKEQLIAQGMDRERIEKMAVGQVLAIYTERNYQRFGDDFEKIWYMPFWESRRRAEQVEKSLDKSRMMSGAADREIIPMVSLLLPALQAGRAAQVRMDRDLAALRIVEALRMYAADNNGKLPAQLTDIKQVPIPLNPATGKPFVYRLEGDTAILDLPLSDGIRNHGRKFEIEIAGHSK
jgi:hypothetical protein